MSEQLSEVYLLDANVFIDAYQRYYAMDLCPGFWECLEHYCQEIRLLSIDHIRDEIDGGDALDTWAAQAPDGLFVSTQEEKVAEAFGDMMRWVQSNPIFSPAAKEEFARAADGWLVAYAKVHGLVVITHEVFDPNIRRKVKIPNVCREFDVPHADTFAMLRSLDVRFGWK